MHGIRVWRYLQCTNICRFKRAQFHSARVFATLESESCLTLWILIERSCHSCSQFLIMVVSGCLFGSKGSAWGCPTEGEGRFCAESCGWLWLWFVLCRSSWMPRMGGGWGKIWIFSGHRKGGCCPCFKQSKKRRQLLNLADIRNVLW